MHKNEVHRDLFKGANRVFKKVCLLASSHTNDDGQAGINYYHG